MTNFAMGHLSETGWRCICSSGHSIFSFARSGLWVKLSDRTEFPVRSSSRAEHEKSPAVHFALISDLTGRSLQLALCC